MVVLLKSSAYSVPGVQNVERNWLLTALALDELLAPIKGWLAESLWAVGAARVDQRVDAVAIVGDWYI